MGALIGSASRYGAVGIGVTIAYLVLASVLNALGTGVVVASAIAFLASTTLSYLGHRRFTFRSSESHARAVPRFLLVSSAGFALAIAIPVTVERFTTLGPGATFLLVTVAVAIFSFAGLRLAVFRVAGDGGRRRTGS